MRSAQDLSENLPLAAFSSRFGSGGPIRDKALTRVRIGLARYLLLLSA
jgi:hypothetical protein